MHPLIMKWISLSFILLLWSNVTLGQNTWSLQDCIEHAINVNNIVKQSALQEELADINLIEAQRSKLPDLSANLGAGLNFGRTIDPTSNQFITETFLSNNAGLSSSILLYSGGRINKNIDASAKRAEIAQWQRKDAEFDLALSVTDLYLAILLAEENKSLSESQLIPLEQQLNDLESLIEAGVRPANDRLEIEALIAQRNLDVLQADNSLNLSKLQLAQLLQIEPETLVISDNEEVGDLLDPFSISEAELFENMLRRDPNTNIVDLRIEEAEINEKIAEAASLPTVSLGGNLRTAYSNQAVDIDGFAVDFVDTEILINNDPVTVGLPVSSPIFRDKAYGDQLSDNVSLGFGLGVSIPIYSNYKIKGSIARAKVSTEMQQIMKDEQARQVAFAAKQLLFEARAAKTNYENAQLVLQAQRVAFENAEKRMQAGLLSNLEYITADTQIRQANVSVILAKYDFLFTLKKMSLYMGQ